MSVPRRRGRRRATAPGRHLEVVGRPLAGEDSGGITPRLPAIVTMPSAAQVRRVQEEVRTLVAAALTQLAAVRDGEYVMIHGAWLDVGRAVQLVVKYRLDDELVKTMAEPRR